MGVSFRETQHFRQKWIVAIIAGITVLMWYSAVEQILLKRPFGNNPAPDIVLIVFWILFGVGFPLFFLKLRLLTEVREDGIYIKFVPINRRFIRIGFDEIDTYEIRKYRPIVEYGGWGVKYGSGGKAYNVSGNMGLQLKLKNGKKVLIGTQRPEEFKLAVESKIG